MLNVQFINANMTLVKWDNEDGSTSSASVDHPQVVAYIAAGGQIAPFVPAPEPTLDQIYDSAIQTQQLLRALVLALNDGSFPVGKNLDSTRIKSAIKSKL